MLRLLTFLSALFMATAAAATTLWVDAPRDGYLNLRSGPSTQYHIVGQMPHGSKVEVLRTPGKWYKLRHDSGAIGWAHSAFLSAHPVMQGIDRDHDYRGPYGDKPGGYHDGKPGGQYGGKPGGYHDGKPGSQYGDKPGGYHDGKPGQYGKPDGATFWVYAPGYGGLNLRHGPGAQYPVIMTMGQRDKVVELGRQGSWILVRHQLGKVGWAHGDYLVTRDPGQAPGHKKGKPWKHKDGGWDNDRDWDRDGYKRKKSNGYDDLVRWCLKYRRGDFDQCVLNGINRHR